MDRGGGIPDRDQEVQTGDGVLRLGEKGDQSAKSHSATLHSKVTEESARVLIPTATRLPV